MTTTKATGSCYDQGTLTLSSKGFSYADHETIYARSLADYEFDSPESMHKTASRYSQVKRPGGKVEKGDDYTLRKAKNDWKKLTS